MGLQAGVVGVGERGGLLDMAALQLFGSKGNQLRSDTLPAPCSLAHLYVCGSGSVARCGVPGVAGGSGGTIQRETSVTSPQRERHSSCHTVSFVSASCRPRDAWRSVCMSTTLSSCSRQGEGIVVDRASRPAGRESTRSPAPL